MRAWAHIAALAFLYWPASMVLASLDLIESVPLKACQNPDTPMSEVISQLANEGWSKVPAPTPEMIEDMAWINATFYFAGDTGGAAFENVMEIQRKAAQGFFRKVDIPQSQTHMFEHPDRLDRMMVLRRVANNQNITLECRVALRQVDLPSELKTQLRQAPPLQDAQFFRLHSQIKAETRYDVTLVRVKVEQKQPPPQAIIFTYTQSPLPQFATP